MMRAGESPPPPPPLLSTSSARAVMVSRERLKGQEVFRKQPLTTGWEALIVRLLLIWGLAGGVAYVYFRWTTWLRSGSPLLLPFLLAETAVLLAQPMALYANWRPMRRPVLTMDQLMDASEYPTVDVLIPCYSEPVDIICQTALAACKMDYPPEKLCVYVLDDSAREEVRSTVETLAAASGCRVRYIARKKYKGVPHHAKAGNLNHAVLHGGIRGQFVVVFDCDMIAMPFFLNAALPHVHKWDENKQAYVIDESMAIVQTPQDFYNVPGHDPLGQRYLYFYDRILPGWEGHGCVPCCGTNVVFSRKALEAIGGFRTESITEDVLTSMTLNAAGYQSCYVNQRMAFGLTPTDIKAYSVQRQRWAVGSIHIFLKDPPFLKEGLTANQRVLYTWMLGQYLLSIPYALLYTLPLLYLVAAEEVRFGAPFSTYIFYFILSNVPQQLVNLLTADDVGVLYWLRGQQEQVYCIFISIQAALLVLCGVNVSFSVTPKEGQAERKEHSLPYVLPHILYIVMSTCGVASFLSQASQGKLTLRPLDLLGYAFDLAYVFTMCFAMLPPIRFFLRPSSAEAESYSITDFLLQRVQTFIGHSLELLHITAPDGSSSVEEEEEKHPLLPSASNVDRSRAGACEADNWGSCGVISVKTSTCDGGSKSRTVSDGGDDSCSVSSAERGEACVDTGAFEKGAE